MEDPLPIASFPPAPPGPPGAEGPPLRKMTDLAQAVVGCALLGAVSGIAGLGVQLEFLATVGRVWRPELAVLFSGRETWAVRACMAIVAGASVSLLVLSAVAVVAAVRRAPFPVLAKLFLGGAVAALAASVGLALVVWLFLEFPAEVRFFEGRLNRGTWPWGLARTATAVPTLVGDLAVAWALQREATGLSTRAGS